MRGLLRKLSTGFDRGLALALLISLLAAWPFLARPSLPRETDAELHVFRAAELAYAIRGGALYPRWASDFYYGYGYPIFNYYAPLAYYLANLLSLAQPGAAVWGVRGVFVLTFLLAGAGMYGLGRRLGGAPAGLVAASGYLFAPYFYLIDPHLRGDLAEFFALGLAPPVFWLLLTHRQASSRLSLAAASIGVAALILSHNLLALAFFALLAGWTAWSLGAAALRRGPQAVRRAAGMLAPLAIGVALSAFFWLPVALERGEVQLGNLIGPGHFDFREHFLTLIDLFGPAVPLDLGSVNPEFRLNLGLPQVALGAAGALALADAFRRRADPSARPAVARADWLYWLLTLAALLLLMTAASRPLWEAVPLLPFFQFPWRLLGPAALSLALLGAFSTRWLMRLPARGRPAALALLVCAPALGVLPILVPPAWGDFGPTDRLAMLDFELNGLALGTTSTGDFLPAAVQMVPAPNPDLIASYRAGAPVDRVNRRTLPPGARVELIAQGPIDESYHITSPEGFTLRLYRFMFAGWRASIDGVPARIEIAQPEGFMTVPVPPGEHTVRVWLGTTTARQAASAISAAALLVLAMLAARLPQPPLRSPSEPLPEWPVVAVGIALIATAAAIGSLAGWLQPHSVGLIPLPADQIVHHYLEGGIDLIGYDLSAREARPGEPLALTLYWKAREPVPANYQVFVHLTSVPEHTWGQSDKLNPGDYPTTRWPLDRYVRDPHRLVIPPGTPPGQYTLRVGLWNHQSGARQLILEADGTILGDSIALQQPVRVLPATDPPTVADLSLDTALDARLAPGVALLGVDLDPGPVMDSPLHLLRVILYWRAGQSSLPDYQVGLRLLDANGIPALQTAAPPADGRYPSSGWQPGEVVRDVHSLWIGPEIASGSYTLEVSLIPPGGGPAHLWTALAVVQRVLP